MVYTGGGVLGRMGFRDEFFSVVGSFFPPARRARLILRCDGDTIAVMVIQGWYDFSLGWWYKGSLPYGWLVLRAVCRKGVPLRVAPGLSSL